MESEQIAGALTRRQILQMGGAAALACLIGSCGEGAGSGTREVLRIFEWQGYDYPSFKALKPFVARNGKPKYAYITSTSEMLTKVKSGFQVDLTHPGVQDLPAMTAFDLIQPWDLSKISRAPQLDQQLLEFGQIDGKQFLMPFDTGPDTVLYRSDLVDAPEPESYSMLYDAKYKGRISWFDAATDNLVIWGLMNGVDNPIDMSDAELAEAKKFLIAHKPLVRNLWTLQTSLEADMAAGDIWVAHGFGASYPPLKKKGIDVTLAWPKEGRLIYSVGYALSKDTELASSAYEFVNTMLSPTAGLELTNTFGYQHPNRDVDLSKVDPETVAAFGLGDPTSIQTPKAYVVKGQSGDRLRAYEKTWSDVKAA